MPEHFETDDIGGAPSSAKEQPAAALTRATRRITTAGSVDEALKAITEEARRLIGAHQAVASCTTGQGEWAQTISATSLSDRYAEWRDHVTPPDGSGISALVCQTNQPMRLTQAELEAHPAWKEAEADRHPPMRGWLAVPLVGRDGQNIGVVQLSDKDGGGDFTGRDETLLVQLAQIAAIAVENAQLYEVAQQRLREAEAERRQLAEIFREAPSSMCILSGPDHVIERANDHYLALVGQRDVVGRPLREALPEVVDQGFIELLDHVYRTGESYVGDDVPVRLFQPDRDEPAERWLNFVYQAIRDAHGAITGIYVQVVDLTERRRVEEALRASEQRLKEANESLEERVAARTAQLRAMTAELNQAEQRERQRLSQILHDDLQQLLVAGKFQLSSAISDDDVRAAQALQRVDSLLEQSICTTRSLTAELSPPVLYDAGLAPALESLGRWMREQQGLEVTVHASETAEPAEQDLRVLLFQAIRELLFNVVKHAGVDRAEVTLRRTGDDRVEATVVDAGRGFDPAASESTPSNNHRFGLFSLRERVAWFGGDMTIDSAPGNGTRVVLNVADEPTRLDEAPPPVERPRESVSATEPPEPLDSEQPTAIKVVIADDHTVVREGLASALSGEPDIAVVGEAADGQEAIDLVRQMKPDVVLLDVSMPRVGGIEAAKAITAESDDTRIVGLSMHDDADMAAAMRAAGAVAYVNKAQASDRLLDAIRRRAE